MKMRMMRCLLTLPATLALAPLAVQAEQLFSETVIVDGKLCAGLSCAAAETFGAEDFKIDDFAPALELEDASTEGGSASTDWTIGTNDDADDNDYVFIGESETATYPQIKLYQGTPVETVVIRPKTAIHARVGINVDPATTGRSETLQIEDNYIPGIALIQTVQTPVGEAVPMEWRIFGSDTQFSISDPTVDSSSLQSRLRVQRAVNVEGSEDIESPLTIGKDGRIGMGVETGSLAPIEKQLHIHGKASATGPNNTTAIRVENVSLVAGNRRMLELINNGAPQFVLTDTSIGRNWLFNMAAQDLVIGSAGQSLRLAPNGRLELRDGNAAPHFSARPNGNLVITGVLTQGSDVHSKTDIAPVAGETVLARLDDLDIATWRYKTDETQAQHLGPMAQDFHAAFGLGEDDTRIAPGDMAGVALAGVKELNQKLVAKDAEIADLKATLALMRERLDRLER